jgi:hypothetical protein
MVEKIGHVKNPLTVIAIFAAVAEISGTSVLPFISVEHQGTYIWFLMLFPFLLVISFFLTLNLNHRVLYAPSDYKDEKHFFGKASEEEIKEKIEHEASLEVSKTSLANEAEPVEGDEDLTNGPTVINEVQQSPTKEQLIQSSLDFERRVLLHLKNDGIPFSYNNFNEEMSIINGSRKVLIDGVIETNNVHYLIEIKNVTRPSSLVNAVHQIENYKSAYESYLRERNIKVVVQPIIIVPSSINVSSSFRGVPVAKFDVQHGNIQNLKNSYSDYTFGEKLDKTENLSVVLMNFLSRYSRWGFSPLRIQQWGSQQLGFENLELYSIDEIRHTLESLLQQGKLKELTSKQGNRLYQISPNKQRQSAA